MQTFFVSVSRAPGFIDDIQSEATQSTVKISWSAPTTRTGQVMDVDHYYITHMFESEERNGRTLIIKKSGENKLELCNLKPYTDSLFTIMAEYQGKFGPQVTIGISTGNARITVHD